MSERTRPDAMDLDQRRILERRLLAGVAHARGEVAPVADPHEPVEVSLLQHRFWFFHKLKPDRPIYQTSACYDVTGPLDVAALSRAVSAVVQRHEVLRTRIVQRADGTPIQHVDPPPDRVAFAERHPPLDMAPADRREHANRQMLAFTGTPFTLADEWPFRARLFQVHEEHSIVAFTLHHVASDGWSLRLLFRDLGAYYDHFTGRARTQPPALRWQYRDYSRWLAGQVGDTRWQEQIAYWRERLTDVPTATNIATDRPRNAAQSFRGGTTGMTIPEPLARNVRSFSAASGCTVFVTLLAAFHVLLHRYSGDELVVVGTPVSCRVRPEWEQLIGVFVNTVALPIDLSGGPDFHGVVDRVRASLVDALDHQDVPFDTVVKELGLHRQLSYNPVFQATFQYNTDGTRPLTLSGLNCHEIHPETESSTFDLSMYLNDEGRLIDGWLAYSRDLFDQATSERIVQHYVTLLASLLSAPHARVDTAMILTTCEREYLLGPEAGDPS